MIRHDTTGVSTCFTPFRKFRVIIFYIERSYALAKLLDAERFWVFSHAFSLFPSGTTSSSVVFWCRRPEDLKDPAASLRGFALLRVFRSVAFLGLAVFAGIGIWYAQLKATSTENGTYNLYNFCAKHAWHVWNLQWFETWQGAGPSEKVLNLLLLALAPVGHQIGNGWLKAMKATFWCVPRQFYCSHVSWSLLASMPGSPALEGIMSGCSNDLTSNMIQHVLSCPLTAAAALALRAHRATLCMFAPLKLSVSSLGPQRKSSPDVVKTAKDSILFKGT